MRGRHRLRLPDRGDLPIVLSYGLLAIGGSMALMNLALLTAPAGRSSVLMYTLPLWVVPLMAVATGAVPTRRETVGLVLGLAGLMLLLDPTAIGRSSQDALAGSAMLLLAALLGAVALVHVRLHHWHGTPFDVQLWQLLVALVPMTVLAFALEAPGSFTWDLRTVLILLYSGPLATAFAYWASQSAAQAIGPLGTSVGFLAVPVVGVIGAALVLGEQVPPSEALGMLVTGVGICTVMLATRTAPRPAEREEPYPSVARSDA
jgi:drug/metabolite transporter (DMT)-like permease